nr:uncharacterized protein LOC117453462 [Pseudochaenichthys georgianus]
MMAAAAVAAERGGGTGGTGVPGRPSPAGASARAEGSSPRPGSAGFSVLVVVGSMRANGLLERLLKQIETGVRCWPVSLDVSVLDQQLKLFVSRHSAFLSQDVPGETTGSSTALFPPPNLPCLPPLPPPAPTPVHPLSFLHPPSPLKAHNPNMVPAEPYSFLVHCMSYTQTQIWSNHEAPFLKSSVLEKKETTSFPKTFAVD